VVPAILAPLSIFWYFLDLASFSLPLLLFGIKKVWTRDFKIERWQVKDKVLVMSEIFKALGDPTRLRIIRMLASKMEDSLCVIDLAKKLGITQPAASQHIRILKSVGILEPNRIGFRVYYSVNAEVLNSYKEDIDKLFKIVFEKCPKYDKCKGHKA
jgi:ArsR family transcriptional regulator